MTTTKKKSRAMQPIVIRMPSALLRMLKQDARKAGKDLSTHIRDVLASSPEPRA